MSEEARILAESKSLEAVNAATNAAQAVEVARAAQIAAAAGDALLRGELLSAMEKAVAKSIQMNVNGKIDAMRTQMAINMGVIRKMGEKLEDHNTKHAENMERITPVLLAFEGLQRDGATAKRAGKGVLWLAGTITALGSAWLVSRSIFHW